MLSSQQCEHTSSSSMLTMHSSNILLLVVLVSSMHTNCIPHFRQILVVVSLKCGMLLVLM